MTKIFNTKKWPKIFFQKVSKKSKIFQIHHQVFSKNIFFEVTNFFEIFFGKHWGVYLPCTQNLGWATIPFHTSNCKFVDLGVFFGPFWTLESQKRAKKRVNRQTFEKKNYRQKKLQIPGFFVEKKSWLYDN